MCGSVVVIRSERTLTKVGFPPTKKCVISIHVQCVFNDNTALWTWTHI